mmetsp:Transcript_90965/g.199243  ORF Transcript_90965/g.199243 Transcript_90965/m.199243 type:complete len:144 (+) Transcript_90965:176-607(+)
MLRRPFIWDSIEASVEELMPSTGRARRKRKVRADWLSFFFKGPRRHRPHNRDRFLRIISRLRKRRGERAAHNRITSSSSTSCRPSSRPRSSQEYSTARLRFGLGFGLRFRLPSSSARLSADKAALTSTEPCTDRCGSSVQRRG